MSILNPTGFRDVMDWADNMTGQLGFLADEQAGSDANYEQLQNPDEWQDWANGLFGGTDRLGQDAPDPYAYDNWREWAERLFATSNFTG